MKKFLSLLLAAMLCCAVFASCGKGEQQAEPSAEPSVEVEASPSPTPEPRMEVGVPEELKFCDEPLYYGMTIEEIREIFGQEDETSERDFYQTGNFLGKHIYYKYNNVQCQGRQVQLQFRIFNYDGVVIPKSYGLDAVVIRWPDVLEEQASFVNDEIRPIVEKLYGEPDSVKEDGIIQLFWDTKEDRDQVTILGKLADGPKITIRTWRVEFWGSIGVREEKAAYRESGKQGVTSANRNRLKIGKTTYTQTEILLGPPTEQTAQYKVGMISYATCVWENEELWNVRITITFRDGIVDAISSSGL